MFFSVFVKVKISNKNKKKKVHRIIHACLSNNIPLENKIVFLIIIFTGSILSQKLSSLIKIREHRMNFPEFRVQTF